MNKKVIFLDIDGTLTEPGSNVPPASALDAIAKAQANGHLVFLCSGRNYGMLSPLLAYSFDGVVGSSGGYVLSGQEVIYDRPMTKEEQDLAMNTLKECGVFRTVECLEGSYTDEGFKEFLKSHSGEGANSELLRWREQIESSLNILPMSNYDGAPAYKIVFMSDSMERLEKPKAVLSDAFTIVIQEPDAFGFVNGEMQPKAFDKGTGVRRVMEYLGIPMEDSIGFGDSMNDLEMMTTVGHSVCMGNGAKALKELSDEVCPAVLEDGMYKAFEKLGLF
ncbi:MAG: HAD family phosphatase [Blautia sp.]|nr:HAD family phosphatase [Blautia sp.]